MDEIKGEYSQEIDAIVANHLDGEGPGAAVAITYYGELIHLKGYGYADLAAEVPLSGRSVFDLASVSKQFTAACVLLLEEQGRLEFKDSVRKWLPELQHPIPIANLLGMTSGLPDYTYGEGVRPKDVLAEVGELPLNFPTGEQYEYINTNYALLTLLIERVSGMSQREFLKKNIFRPLGMLQSDFLETDAYPKSCVRGYKNSAGELDEWPLGGLGDGNVLSSASDLALWLAAMRDHKCLSKESWKRAHRSGKLTSGQSSGYGFGWQISQDDNRCIWHGGSWYGSLTRLSWYPDTDYGMAVLCNFSEGPLEPLCDELDAYMLS